MYKLMSDGLPSKTVKNADLIHFQTIYMEMSILATTGHLSDTFHSLEVCAIEEITKRIRNRRKRSARAAGTGLARCGARGELYLLGDERRMYAGRAHQGYREQDE